MTKQNFHNTHFICRSGLEYYNFITTASPRGKNNVTKNIKHLYFLINAPDTRFVPTSIKYKLRGPRHLNKKLPLYTYLDKVEGCCTFNTEIALFCLVNDWYALSSYCLKLRKDIFWCLTCGNIDFIEDRSFF